MSARRGGESFNVRAPKRDARPPRALVGILLSLLLPPLGLVYLWRLGVFRVRGRMLITAIATAEMMAVAILLTPRATPETISPVPGEPARVTAAPQGEALTALSNIEQILRAQETVAPEATASTSIVDQLDASNPENAAILKTVVYAVYGSGAEYYHAGPVCGDQQNNRQLTVAEAMAELLGACPDCNPPRLGQSLADPTATPAPAESPAPGEL